MYCQALFRAGALRELREGMLQQRAKRVWQPGFPSGWEAELDRELRSFLEGGEELGLDADEGVQEEGGDHLGVFLGALTPANRKIIQDINDLKRVLTQILDVYLQRVNYVIINSTDETLKNFASSIKKFMETQKDKIKTEYAKVPNKEKNVNNLTIKAVFESIIKSFVDMKTAIPLEYGKLVTRAGDLTTAANTNFPLPAAESVATSAPAAAAAGGDGTGPDAGFLSDSESDAAVPSGGGGGAGPVPPPAQPPPDPATGAAGGSAGGGPAAAASPGTDSAAAVSPAAAGAPGTDPAAAPDPSAAADPLQELKDKITQIDSAVNGFSNGDMKEVEKNATDFKNSFRAKTTFDDLCDESSFDAFRAFITRIREYSVKLSGLQISKLADDIANIIQNLKTTASLNAAQQASIATYETVLTPLKQVDGELQRQIGVYESDCEQLLDFMIRCANAKEQFDAINKDMGICDTAYTECVSKVAGSDTDKLAFIKDKYENEFEGLENSFQPTSVFLTDSLSNIAGWKSHFVDYISETTAFFGDLSVQFQLASTAIQAYNMSLNEQSAKYLQMKRKYQEWITALGGVAPAADAHWLPVDQAAQAVLDAPGSVDIFELLQKSIEAMGNRKKEFPSFIQHLLDNGLSGFTYDTDILNLLRRFDEIWDFYTNQKNLDMIEKETRDHFYEASLDIMKRGLGILGQKSIIPKLNHFLTICGIQENFVLETSKDLLKRMLIENASDGSLNGFSIDNAKTMLKNLYDDWFDESDYYKTQKGSLDNFVDNEDISFLLANRQAVSNQITTVILAANPLNTSPDPNSAADMKQVSDFLYAAWKFTKEQFFPMPERVMYQIHKMESSVFNINRGISFFNHMLDMKFNERYDELVSAGNDETTASFLVRMYKTCLKDYESEFPPLTHEAIVLFVTAALADDNADVFSKYSTLHESVLREFFRWGLYLCHKSRNTADTDDTYYAKLKGFFQNASGTADDNTTLLLSLEDIKTDLLAKAKEAYDAIASTDDMIDLLSDDEASEESVDSSSAAGGGGSSSAAAGGGGSSSSAAAGGDGSSSAAAGGGGLVDHTGSYALDQSGLVQLVNDSFDDVFQDSAGNDFGWDTDDDFLLRYFLYHVIKKIAIFYFECVQADVTITLGSVLQDEIETKRNSIATKHADVYIDGLYNCMVFDIFFRFLSGYLKDIIEGGDVPGDIFIAAFKQTITALIDPNIKNIQNFLSDETIELPVNVLDQVFSCIDNLSKCYSSFKNSFEEYDETNTAHTASLLFSDAFLDGEKENIRDIIFNMLIQPRLITMKNSGATKETLFAKGLAISGALMTQPWHGVRVALLTGAFMSNQAQAVLDMDFDKKAAELKKMLEDGFFAEEDLGGNLLLTNHLESSAVLEFSTYFGSTLLKLSFKGQLKDATSADAVLQPLVQKIADFVAILEKPHATTKLTEVNAFLSGDGIDIPIFCEILPVIENFQDWFSVDGVFASAYKNGSTPQTGLEWLLNNLLPVVQQFLTDYNTTGLTPSQRTFYELMRGTEGLLTQIKVTCEHDNAKEKIMQLYRYYALNLDVVRSAILFFQKMMNDRSQYFDSTSTPPRLFRDPGFTAVVAEFEKYQAKCLYNWSRKVTDAFGSVSDQKVDPPYGMEDTLSGMALDEWNVKQGVADIDTTKQKLKNVFFDIEIDLAASADPALRKIEPAMNIKMKEIMTSAVECVAHIERLFLMLEDLKQDPTCVPTATQDLYKNEFRDSMKRFLGLWEDVNLKNGYTDLQLIQLYFLYNELIDRFESFGLMTNCIDKVFEDMGAGWNAASQNFDDMNALIADTHFLNFLSDVHNVFKNEMNLNLDKHVTKAQAAYYAWKPAQDTFLQDAALKVAEFDGKAPEIATAAAGVAAELVHFLNSDDYSGLKQTILEGERDKLQQANAENVALSREIQTLYTAYNAAIDEVQLHALLTFCATFAYIMPTLSKLEPFLEYEMNNRTHIGRYPFEYLEVHLNDLKTSSGIDVLGSFPVDRADGFDQDDLIGACKNLVTSTSQPATFQDLFNAVLDQIVLQNIDIDVGAVVRGIQESLFALPELGLKESDADDVKTAAVIMFCLGMPGAVNGASTVGMDVDQAWTAAGADADLQGFAAKITPAVSAGAAPPTLSQILADAKAARNTALATALATNAILFDANFGTNTQSIENFVKSYKDDTNLDAGFLAAWEALAPPLIAEINTYTAAVKPADERIQSLTRLATSISTKALRRISAALADKESEAAALQVDLANKDTEVKTLESALSAAHASASAPPAASSAIPSAFGSGSGVSVVSASVGRSAAAKIAKLEAHIVQLEKWGRANQDLARKQYAIYQKVREFYGDVYVVGKPKAEQQLDSAPVLP